jgi:nitronate monooxygenase
MNLLARRLGIGFPLLQAGMGGIAGPRLAAAVAGAGGGGVLALYKSEPAAITALVQETRARTSAPFGVNLIPELVSDGELCAQIDAALEASDADVFFVLYGVPREARACHPLRAAGRALIVQVGTVADAERAAALGADALVLQDVRAGGHLLGEATVCELFDQLRHLRLPKLAAGSVATGEEFRRLWELGFDGCMCGTAFVCADESEAHDVFKARVVSAREADTVVTDVFDIGWPGRRHRVLRNVWTEGRSSAPARFIATITIQGRTVPVPRFSSVVPTRATRGAVDEMAMYCGTSCERVHAVVPAAEIVKRFVEGFHAPAAEARP